MQKSVIKIWQISKEIVYLHRIQGFVKILHALVKSSLVFVLVGGWRLPALIFVYPISRR